MFLPPAGNAPFPSLTPPTAPDAAQVGLHPDLSRKNIIKISDDHDPVQYMVDTIRRESGRPDNLTELEITGSFERVDSSNDKSPVKVYPYMNAKEGVECYSFVQEWQASFNVPVIDPTTKQQAVDTSNGKLIFEQKTLTFSRNIYTNIAYPTTKGDHTEKDNAVALLSTVFTNFLQEATHTKLDRSHQSSSREFDALKHRMDQILSQGHLRVEAFSGDKKVRLDRDLHTRNINYIRFHLTPVGEKEKEEYRVISTTDHVALKVFNEAKQKFVVHAKPESPAHIKELARIQKGEGVRDQILEGLRNKENLDDNDEEVVKNILRREGIEADDYGEYMEGRDGVNVKLRNQFQVGVNYFKDPRHINSLVYHYGNKETLSPEVENLFNPKKGFFTKLQEKVRPAKTQDPWVILQDALKNTKDQKSKEYKELLMIQGCFYALHKEMFEANLTLNVNEETLKWLEGTTDKTRSKFRKIQQKRTNKLNDIRQKMKLNKIPPGLMPPQRPPLPQQPVMQTAPQGAPQFSPGVIPQPAFTPGFPPPQYPQGSGGPSAQPPQVGPMQQSPPAFTPQQNQPPQGGVPPVQEGPPGGPISGQ